MEKIYFYKTSKKKVIGIIIIPIPGTNKTEGKKYSYIDNSPRGVNTFLAFAKRKFVNATHVNFYDPAKTGKEAFMETINLE